MQDGEGHWTGQQSVRCQLIGGFGPFVKGVVRWWIISGLSEGVRGGARRPRDGTAEEAGPVWIVSGRGGSGTLRTEVKGRSGKSHSYTMSPTLHSPHCPPGLHKPALGVVRAGDGRRALPNSHTPGLPEAAPGAGNGAAAGPRPRTGSLNPSAPGPTLLSLSC